MYTIVSDWSKNVVSTHEDLVVAINHMFSFVHLCQDGEPLHGLYAGHQFAYGYIVAEPSAPDSWNFEK